MAIDTTSPRTRRALLGAGLGAIAATAASAIGRPAATNAGGVDPVFLNQNNVATTTTQISTTDTVAFWGSSGSLIGVYGSSTSHAGVYGSSVSSIGVYGSTSSYAGVFGTSISHAGVVGYSGTTLPSTPKKTGVLGRADQDASSVGVRGISAKGRGGRFRGKKAQIKLDPSTATIHPASGARGDFFVDRSGRLWFCKGSTNWRQLA